MKGWECPKCGRCYAPFVMECSVCGPLMLPQQAWQPVCTCGNGTAAGMCPVHVARPPYTTTGTTGGGPT